MLDKLFLQYEVGVKLTPHPRKTTLKKPSLARVKLQDLFNNQRRRNKYENLDR